MTFEYKNLEEFDDAGYPKVETSLRSDGKLWSAWVGDRRNPQYLAVGDTEANALIMLVKALALVALGRQKVSRA